MCEGVTSCDRRDAVSRRDAPLRQWHRRHRHVASRMMWPCGACSGGGWVRGGLRGPMSRQTRSSWARTRGGFLVLLLVSSVLGRMRRRLGPGPGRVRGVRSRANPVPGLRRRLDDDPHREPAGPLRVGRILHQVPSPGRCAGPVFEGNWNVESAHRNHGLILQEALGQGLMAADPLLVATSGELRFPDGGATPVFAGDPEHLHDLVDVVADDQGRGRAPGRQSSRCDASEQCVTCPLHFRSWIGEPSCHGQ